MRACAYLNRCFGRSTRSTRRHTSRRPSRSNAADYGVPQIRERIFVLASIDGRQIEVPEPTHGQDPSKEPFLTAWDAIGDLDVDSWPAELDARGRWAGLLPSIPEGQNYLWHTPRNV